MINSDILLDIEKMKKVASEYYDALQKEKELIVKYAEMQERTESGVIQSRRSIQNRADDVLAEEHEEIDRKIKRIKEIRDQLQYTEHTLVTQDYDYEGYLMTVEQGDDSAFIPTDFDEAIDYMEKALTAAQKLVEESIKSKRSFIARALKKRIPDSKRTCFEKIHNAVKLGMRISDTAEGSAWSVKQKIADDIDFEKQQRIANVENETRDRVELNAARARAEMLALENAFDAKLNGYITEEESEILEILSHGESEQSDIFSEALVIGKLALPIQLYEAARISKAFYQKYCRIIQNNAIVFPAIQNMKTNTSIMLFGDDDTNTVSVIEGLVYTSLLSQPVLKQHVYVFDPVGQGTNFRDILPFIKKYPSVTGGSIMTNRQEMRACLDNLLKRMVGLVQSTLVDYENVFEYNRKAQARPEHLTYLCIHHFPYDFDEELMKKLLSIMENSGRCGVQIILSMDEEAIPIQRQDLIELIGKIRSYCIAAEKSNARWLMDGVMEWLPPVIPGNDQMIKFTNRYDELAETAIKKTLPLNTICEGTWGFNSAEKLSIPIGENGNGSVRYLEFGDPVSQGTSHHALIFGSLGSGKSTLLHTIIMSAIKHYSSDELNLYLLDFKEGTEFKIYETLKVPHIKVLALDAMQEFGKSVLEEISKIAKERLEKFTKLTEADTPVKNISQYRAVTGEPMPRILVIMDEFQMLFNEDSNRRVAHECAKLFSDIVALYRVCGIHCILATQTMKRIKSGNFSIPTATMDEMKVRIGLKCDSSECSLIFKDTYGHAAFSNMGLGKGEGVYTENVEVSEPVGFKVAYCDDNTQNSMLRELGERFNPGMRVFTGKSVPVLQESTAYRNRMEEVIVSDDVILLGEPIKIADPVMLKISRMKKNTLLICGGSNALAERILSSYIYSCKNKLGNADSVYLFDGNTIMGSGMSERIGYATQKLGCSLTICDNVFQVVELIDQIYDVYEERRKQIHAKSFHGGNIYVVINDLQMIEPLTLLFNGKSAEEYVMESDSTSTIEGNSQQSNTPIDMSAIFESVSFDTPISSAKGTSAPRHKKLHSLIATGHTCNIHFVVATTDLQPMRNTMYEFVPLFANKIVFAMSDTEAGRIIPDIHLGTMLPNVAMFSDGNNLPYQFKPYDII